VADEARAKKRTGLFLQLPRLEGLTYTCFCTLMGVMDDAKVRRTEPKGELY
jgi:hypothetical protein